MIRGFRDKETERIFTRQGARRVAPPVQRSALRKLVLVHAASTLNDLRVPPGNRLEQLSGNRLGQYSIRVNDQYRICFTWQDGHAYDVELTDYHS